MSSAASNRETRLCASRASLLLFFLWMQLTGRGSPAVPPRVVLTSPREPIKFKNTEDGRCLTAAQGLAVHVATEKLP
ncbi:hypothetical protein DAI22_01g143200 [Oryza sativa Japonica Group]|nr:hypothetical protein DAI22_01g143200 [Oryza sativa Japonica Group]